jgi:hypothetical protein
MPYGEMFESRIKDDKVNNKRGREERKEEKVWRIRAPKQSLQFFKFFETRFGGWLFVYP